MSELYKRIESLCSNRGISITTMCKESSASRASLSDLKVGRKQSLSADTLSKIASFFGVTVDYLLTGTSSYTPSRSSNEENPWEAELLEAFDGLSLGNQIEAVAQVQRIAGKKEAPTENGERKVSDEDIKFALFGGDGEITDAMFDEVKRFAEMVKLREDTKKKKEQ